MARYYYFILDTTIDDFYLKSKKIYISIKICQHPQKISGHMIDQEFFKYIFQHYENREKFVKIYNF